MKTIVSVNEISEFEIKPQAELEEWKKLVNEEIDSLLKDKSKWIKVSCPVCNSSSSIHAFNKLSFSYVECSNCKTLYAESRPENKAIVDWYVNSKSAKFWQDTLLKLSSVSRNAKIIEPRAHWILDGISEYISTKKLDTLRYTDISFFGKMLTDKIVEVAGELSITAAGVTIGNENYSNSSVKIAPLSSVLDFSSLPKTDILVAIDLIDRVPDIKSFFQNLESVIEPGGLFFGTCPVSSGFAIQSLWNKSPSIIPPDKLNLPSVKGLLKLFDFSSRWQILELSTPGMFDVELVRQQLMQSSVEDWPRSLHALLDGINKQGAGLFTEYLQSQRLSSFARIVLRRQRDKII